jgi:hypothetical protein
MATTYKVLGQVAPSATTATSLYTAPGSTSVLISTLAVCNRATTTGTFRVAIRPGGEGLANKHYIVYASNINSYESAFLTLGITLAATDIVEVYASSADFSFSLFGSEIT